MQSDDGRTVIETDRMTIAENNFFLKGKAFSLASHPPYVQGQNLTTYNVRRRVVKEVVSIARDNASTHFLPLELRHKCYRGQSNGLIK